MTKKLILPVLALALVAGACEEDDPTVVTGQQATVRFVNAVRGVTGNVAFTANGSVVGSSLGFGAATSQCTTINPGNVTLAFGTANTAGTGISGTALLSQSQTIGARGDYTLIATGTTTNPQFVLLNNDAFTGTVASGQTAVRFVNLVPTVGTSASNFNVFTGTTTTGTPTASAVAYGGTSTFATLPAGNTTFTFTNATGGTTVYTNTGAALNLTSGTVNTVAIMPNSAGTGYQLMNITGC